ncbi:MAG: metalloregulator ArsR/SmtB family transcription factor [Bacillus subtilis]|nr:metalloregulator ArsR/SmtB family transcription factor [Bacillus subtilis]
MEELALMFKALADPNRLKIMELLIQGETCGCTLIDKLPISQPTLSYHLRQLTDAGLTTATKDGTWKKHHVDMAKLDELIEILDETKALGGDMRWYAICLFG